MKTSTLPQNVPGTTVPTGLGGAPLEFLTWVTALTGGTIIALDGQAVAGVPTPRIYKVIVGGVAKFYELVTQDGSYTPNGTTIIAPVVTNTKVFVLLDEASASAALAAETARATAAEGSLADALAGLSSIYQPLEDQRLSTGDSPTFAGLTLMGDLAGQSGDLIANPSSGEITFGSANLTTTFGNVNAFGFSESGNGYNGLFGDSITNTNLGLWDFGGAVVQSSGYANFGGGYVGAYGDLIANTNAGLWDFGGAVVQSSGYANFGGGYVGAYGDLIANQSAGLWDFGAATVQALYVYSTGGVQADGGFQGAAGDYISNATAGLWSFGNSGAEFANGSISIGDSAGDQTWTNTGITCTDVQTNSITSYTSVTASGNLSGQVLITTGAAPAHTASGSAGQMIFTDTYTYRCFASGDWRRSAVTYSTY